MSSVKWDTEAFIRAWLKHGKSKSWKEFAEKMNKESEAAGAGQLSTADNYKQLHLRCCKIQQVVNKSDYKGVYPRPVRPKLEKKKIADLLKYDKSLHPPSA